MTNPEYNWAMKILRKSAYSPHLENFKIEEGAIIPFGKEGEPPTTITPNTKLSSVLLIRSKELQEIKYSINTMTYYTLVPISAEEEKLVKEIGTEKFMEMLDSKDVVDLNRKLLV